MAYVISPPMLCISDRQIDRTVQEAASGNDTLTGNCVHKSADFLLSTIYPWKTGSFYASISSTIYPWKTGSFYASISRWVITYCFDINVKICNVLICLELIKMLPKSIHQIAPFSFQNSKIFQLLRGAHPPSVTPLCAQARNWRWRATQSSPQCSKRIYAPVHGKTLGTWYTQSLCRNQGGTDTRFCSFPLVPLGERIVTTSSCVQSHHSDYMRTFTV